MPVDTVDMQNDSGHVDPERLAAFDDEAPTGVELAHLARCAACRRERDAFDALRTMALTTAVPLAPDAPRLTDWERLSAGLRREGLLASVAETVTTDASTRASRLPASRMPIGGASPVPASSSAAASRRPASGWMRVAAALVLTAGGALLGRASAGAPLSGVSATVDASSPTAATLAAGGADVEGFASVQQATDVLSRAQREYERASLWLAANDTTVHSSDVYRARLAALDQMMTASRAALRDAPQDPVLNHYFLAAYTAREATLQALGGTLPVDKSLERY